MDVVAESAWEDLLVDVRQTADLLGLRDWRIEVSPEPPASDDVIAQVTPFPSRRMARLQVGVGWGGLTLDEQRRALCHELVHLHFAALGEAIVRDVKAWMPEQTWEMCWANLRDHLEHGVDAVANVLVSRFQL